MSFRKLRRSGRIRKSIPILLIGSDTEGRVFSEETHTVVLSMHGAGVTSSHKLLAEQEMILRSLESGQEAEIRVVGEIAAQEGQHTYGVAFVNDDLDFWQLEFPPPPSPEERPLELLLECNGCGRTVTVLNGDYEFDLCAIHGGLVRYCAECGFATVWRRPDPNSAARTAQRRTEQPARPSLQREGLEPRPSKPSPEEQRIPMPETRQAAPAPGIGEGQKALGAHGTAIAVEDRRQRMRAKVNYMACVRSEAFGDDIVKCVDMSRGGLGFLTKNPYLVSTEVRIAVPFALESPGAPAIFVAARVVNIRELPERQIFRCGVMFLPAAGSQTHR